MTDSMFHWNPLFPALPVVVVSIIIFAALAIIEVRRKMRFRYLRVFAQLVIVVSLSLLVLQPAIVVRNETGSVLLLTEGYQDSVVNNILKERSNLETISLPGVRPYKDSEQLRSINELASIGGRIHTIAGNGLPQWAIDLLPNPSFAFNALEQSVGVTKLELPTHAYTNRWNKLRGVFTAGEQPASIVLRGPGGVEDSVVLNGPGEVPFELSYYAKAPGRFNYEITYNNTTNDLPVIIEPEHPLDIVFISDYPTFELRYLKNFLASKGHKLAVRNQLSKGKYKFEYANRPSLDFKSLSEKILSETDLLLIDERSWFGMSSAEQKNIQNAIVDGLGVVVIPERKSDKNKKRLIAFEEIPVQDTTSIKVSKTPSFTLPALPLESSTSKPILKGTDDRVVSGYQYAGAGKIGFQLLQETFQQGLQGKAEAYSELWVPLFEACARTVRQNVQLRVTSPFPWYENEPVDFDVVTSGTRASLKIDSVDLPLSEDVMIDDIYHGTVWLEGDKWNEFRTDSVVNYVHLSKPGSWNSLRAANNIRATAFVSGEGRDTNASSVSYDDRKPKVILFVLFVLAAGFVWISPKL